jgi:hypothetical protein
MRFTAYAAATLAAHTAFPAFAHTDLLAEGPSSPAEGSYAPTAQTQQEQIEELERRIAALADEIENIDVGSPLNRPIGQGQFGFAPAASKIYSVDQGLSLGGYGEMLYTGNTPGSDELDFLRAIAYVGYKFNDEWLLNSEFEIEHATVADNNDGGGEEAPGSVSAEFVYLDYTPGGRSDFGVRAGLVLSPMGFINELHEPTTFLSANRPELERQIIPSTWRENGIGIFGESEDWSWRVYLINGLNGEGFSPGGLRGGRQKGGKASAEDLAIVGRVDYVGSPGLIAGVSAYSGGSGQNNSFTANTTIFDAHVDYRNEGLRLRAIYVMATVDDVEELNAAKGIVAGESSVGEELSGFYVEAGYDIARYLGFSGPEQLIPFVRYEEFDTQAEVPDGFISDPANDRSSVTFGISYMPIPQVAIKVDYVDNDNGADSATDLVRAAVTYVF